MKLPLHTFLPLLMASSPMMTMTDAYSTTPSLLHHRTSPSRSSRRRLCFIAKRIDNRKKNTRNTHNTRLYYTNPNDLSSSSSENGKKNNDPNNEDQGVSNANVWTVLANTERWISDTLDRSNRAASEMKETKKGGDGNTYSSSTSSASTSTSPSSSSSTSSSASASLPPNPPAFYATSSSSSSPSSSSLQESQKAKEARNSPESFSAEQPPSPPPPPPPTPSTSGDNPYARKEVSYVCETGDELTSVVGGIFRRVRLAREMGEGHGRRVEEQMELMGSRGDSSYAPATMRQTNVVVIPNCEEISKFHVFDELMQAINQARRKARDFVISKHDVGGEDGDNSKWKDWVVSINCAHLHPQYGEPTPEEIMQAMKDEDESGEVDVNQQEYKKRRDEARRSPYPSVIVEVQSTPPPDYKAAAAPPPSSSSASSSASKAKMRNGDSDDSVTSEDVKRLEALFTMSAAKKSSDDTFYDALGEAFGDKQLSAKTPLEQAQNWILHNDPAFDEKTSTFTNSDTRHVDAAFEFVFHNLAMLNHANNNRSENNADSSSPNTSSHKPETTTIHPLSPSPKRGQKSYIVLPNFLPTSATSFDRFAGQASNILRVMPSMAKKVTVSTFHPEHVEKNTRSPVPILVFTWK